MRYRLCRALCALAFFSFLATAHGAFAKSYDDADVCPPVSASMLINRPEAADFVLAMRIARQIPDSRPQDGSNFSPVHDRYVAPAIAAASAAKFRLLNGAEKISRACAAETASRLYLLTIQDAIESARSGGPLSAQSLYERLNGQTPAANAAPQPSDPGAAVARLRGKYLRGFKTCDPAKLENNPDAAQYLAEASGPAAYYLRLFAALRDRAGKSLIEYRLMQLGSAENAARKALRRFAAANPAAMCIDSFAILYLINNEPEPEEILRIPPGPPGRP